MSEEVVEAQPEEPKLGTLAWLATKPHIDWFGLEIPECHRIPADATRATEPSTRCQVLRNDGVRCRAVATKRYGLCVPHAGGGGPDIQTLSHLGHEAQRRMRVQRKLLGIGPARAGSARSRARLQAAARADEIATALVDRVLDDEEIGTLARQQAVLRILDATEPLQQTTVEVELPTDQAGVSSMGWSEMQQLAAQLLSEA